MPAVSDSSALILYAKIRRLHLLRDVFREILVPPAVHEEVSVRGRGRAGALEILHEPWIKVRDLADPGLARSLAGQLDPGEAEAIGLAAELGGALTVILDDLRGRKIASEHGLLVTGSAGVLVFAKQRGIIPLVGSVLDELRSAGLRLGDDAYREILSIAGER